jgi:hypothetical protein
LEPAHLAVLPSMVEVVEQVFVECQTYGLHVIPHRDSVWVDVTVSICIPRVLVGTGSSGYGIQLTLPFSIGMYVIQYLHRMMFYGCKAVRSQQVNGRSQYYTLLVKLSITDNRIVNRPTR